MTTPEEVARVAASLTKAQIDALVNAATLLDFMAGEGICMAEGPRLCADEVVMALSDAFDLSWDQDFGSELRAHLQANPDTGRMPGRAG